MFLGRREPPEEVKASELPALLESLFGRKTLQLSSRAEAMLEELRSKEEEFIKACDYLDGIEDEPELEEVYLANTGSVKSQKSTYAKTLKRAMSEYRKAADSGNAYEKYKRIYTDAEAMIREIMGINGTYRLAFLAYSRHLGSFKKNFSSIEKLVASLKSELDRGEPYYSEYLLLKGKLSELMGVSSELEELKDFLSSHPPGSDAPPGSEAAGELAEKLAAKEAEVASAYSAMLRSQQRIAWMLQPLERASRKYDHLSLEKRKLAEFISIPQSLESQEEYSIFAGLAKGLAAGIKSGSIEVKNADETIASVGFVLSGDLKREIERARSSREEKASLEAQASALRQEHLKMLDKGSRAERLATERKSASEDAERLRTEEKNLCEELEWLLKKHYGKTVKLLL